MSLSERLNNQQANSLAGNTALMTDPAHQNASPSVKSAASPLMPNAASTPPRYDPVAAELRQRVHQLLIDELGPILFDNRLTEDELRRKVNEQLQAAVALERVPLSAADKARLIQDVTDDILGYGPIDRLLKEEAVTEIMVNGPDRVFVERDGKLTKDPSIRFLNEDHVRRVIDKIVSAIGRRIDESTPMVDARLPDGSRVNAVIAPLAIGGPFLTIRKFSADPLQIEDLIRFGSVNVQAAEFLQACILGRLNGVVSGGTGSGKTTMLNVLSSFIPDDERIVTVEDAKELQLHQEHVLSMESRPSNVEGRGEVTIRDLVKNCLRMRPDRIVVGECRSGEALDMLQAMNTGHDGSLTTVHANSPRDTLARLETLVLMAGFDLPIRAIREQMASAIDIIVQLTRLRDGTRRVTHITEVQGMEGDIITLQDVFLFDFGAGVDEHGRFRGELRATGVRPKFAEKLADQGILLGAEVFNPNTGLQVPTGRL
ncbi:MAG: CpaF family protein [Microthrixaceae bacterium]